MNALVKWTSVHADVWMIIMVRSAVIAFAVAAFAASRGITLRVNNRRTMFLRCAVGLTAMILYFTALARIPIGQAVTLQYTAPLFVALLSGKVLAERVSAGIALLVITAFAGIVLIVSPELGKVEPDALLALGSGFFAAFAYMYVRELRTTDSPTSVVFWFAAHLWQAAWCRRPPTCSRWTRRPWQPWSASASAREEAKSTSRWPTRRPTLLGSRPSRISPS